jgi:hypothetical protein
MYIFLGLGAGVIVWALQELVLQGIQGSYLTMNLLHGALTGICFGFAFGILDGLAMGERRKALATGGIGAASGLFSGALAFALAAWVLGLLSDIYRLPRQETLMVLLPIARIVGWTCMGLLLGLAEGLRSRSLRRTVAGALGGGLGGLLGGAALEAGLYWLSSPVIGRLLGFLILGLAQGFFIGWFESKAAFGRLKVLTGKHKHREYLLFRKTTRIGKNWLMDVYLPQIDGVEDCHALIKRQQRGFTIQSHASAAVLVNDTPLTGVSELKYEDVLDIGTARLLFLPLQA